MSLNRDNPLAHVTGASAACLIVGATLTLGGLLGYGGPIWWDGFFVGLGLASCVCDVMRGQDRELLVEVIQDLTSSNDRAEEYLEGLKNERR